MPLGCLTMCRPNPAHQASRGVSKPYRQVPFRQGSLGGSPIQANLIRSSQQVYCDPSDYIPTPSPPLSLSLSLPPLRAAAASTRAETKGLGKTIAGSTYKAQVPTNADWVYPELAKLAEGEAGVTAFLAQLDTSLKQTKRASLQQSYEDMVKLEEQRAREKAAAKTAKAQRKASKKGKKSKKGKTGK